MTRGTDVSAEGDARAVDKVVSGAGNYGERRASGQGEHGNGQNDKLFHYFFSLDLLVSSSPGWPDLAVAYNQGPCTKGLRDN